MRNRSARHRTENVIGLHAKENEKAPGPTAMRLNWHRGVWAITLFGSGDDHVTSAQAARSI